MFNFLSEIGKIGMNLLNWYSAFVITVNNNKPKSVDTLIFWVREFAHILDAFIKGKLIEPYQWEQCAGYLDKDNNYEEEYGDTAELYQDSKSLFLYHRGDVVQVYVKLSSYNCREIFAENAKPLKYKLLSVHYRSDAGDDIVVNVPDEYYVENNEILSNVFIARYLRHHHPDVHFDGKYTLEIMDYDLNTLTLKPHEYILLERDGIKIQH